VNRREHIDIIYAHIYEGALIGVMELKQWFVDRGIREQKVDMVPAGIQPEMFKSAAPEKFRARHQLATAQSSCIPGC
jgi:hypothetical protein